MRNLVFKSLYQIGVPSLLRMSKKEAITVLSLHRISEDRDFFFDPIRPNIFISILEYCTSHYDIIQFQDIEKKSSKPKMILSFDDGYYDFIEIAMPIMQKFGVPSNHNFVNDCLQNNTTIWTQKLNDIFNHLKEKNITNDVSIADFTGSFDGNWWSYYLSVFRKLLDTPRDDRDLYINHLEQKYNTEKRYRMINWDEIKLLSKNRDVEIGSHTFFHSSFSSVNNPDILKIEIEDSITEMSKRIGKDVNILALPNGQFNREVINFSNKIGIKHLLFVDDKVNHQNSINSQFNQISRIGMLNESKEESILRLELLHTKIRK